MIKSTRAIRYGNYDDWTILHTVKTIVHDKLSIGTAVNYLQLKCDKASNDYIL